MAGCAHWPGHWFKAFSRLIPRGRECLFLADSGGSQFFPKAAREKNGGAAMVSYAGNLVERQLSNFLTGGTQHEAVEHLVT